jgi:hypothetical protein
VHAFGDPRFAPAPQSGNLFLHALGRRAIKVSQFLHEQRLERGGIDRRERKRFECVCSTDGVLFAGSRQRALGFQDHVVDSGVRGERTQIIDRHAEPCVSRDRFRQVAERAVMFFNFSDGVLQSTVQCNALRAKN